MLERKPKLPVQQLIVLSICRVSEPIVFTSSLPYLPEMVEYVGVPKNEVAKWVGVASAITAVCQCAMAVAWGTASDYAGRKTTILLGLTFTMIFSLVFGFSQSLATMLWARAFLGLMNGNIGIIRTMVAEMVPEKELQPRAFSLMPLIWTVGTIFGPAMGGTLARPAEKHPQIFGKSEFWKEFPFLLPNLASAFLFIIGIMTGVLFLRETLSTRKDKRDYGLMLGQFLTRPCTSRKGPVDSHDHDAATEPLLREDRGLEQTKPAPRRPSWREVLSPQSTIVLLAHATLSMHTMAFDSLLPVFLHSSEQEVGGNPDVHLPFKFVGGFGIGAQEIGFLYTLIGIIGISVQFLLFPWIAKRFGVLKCARFVFFVFPIVYLIIPFSVLAPKSIRNFCVFALMLAKLSASVFAFPCCIILLTNTAASMSVLGALNGFATSISALGRAIGPAVSGATFSFGVGKGYVIIPWWTLAVLAALTTLLTFRIKETDGFKGNDTADDEEADPEAEVDNGNADGRQQDSDERR